MVEKTKIICDQILQLRSETFEKHRVIHRKTLIIHPVKNPSSMTSMCETFEKLRKLSRGGYISTRMRSSAFFFLNFCKVNFFLAAAFPFAFAAGEQP